MSNPLSAYIEDIDTALDTYATVRWHFASNPDLDAAGTFGAEAAQETLAAGQRLYQDEHAAGTEATWYRWRLVDAGATVTSSWSEAFRGGTVTLLQVIEEANRRSGNGWSGTTTAAAEDDCKLFDSSLRDSSQDELFGEGAWVYLREANAADRIRRYVEFYPNSGGIRVQRSWGTPPAEGDPYAVFLMLAPFEYPAAGYTWADAVRDAMRAMSFPDQLDIGALNDSPVNPRYDLSSYAGYIRSRHDVRRVLVRNTMTTGEVFDVDAHKNGRYWEVHENGRGGLYLDVFGAPPAMDTLSLIVEVDRNWLVPYSSGDVTDCPYDLAVRGAIWKAYAQMNSLRSGKYAQELVHKFSEFREEARFHNVMLTGVTL